VNDAERQLQDHGVAPRGADSDARQVARSLRRTGPLQMEDLRAQPELRGWSSDRVEKAVVAAWSADRITIDAGDRLVAL
jgi:hypothetical protein